MAWFSRLFKKGQPERREPDAFVRLDFVHTFPHMIWVSSVGFDRNAPDGFRYKMFAVRREPDMSIELLLFRQLEDGTKQKGLHVKSALSNFGTTSDLIRELEQSANVSFEQHDLSNVRTLDELITRAVEVGWETGFTE